MDLEQNQIFLLIEKALSAQKLAYCPFSNHPVGAAVLAESGDIIVGTNIETSTSNLGICAERMALFTAFMHDNKIIKALAVVTPDGHAPCGVCRQVIYQLCGDIPIIIAKPDKTYTISSTIQLLPLPFDLRICGSSIE